MAICLRHKPQIKHSMLQMTNIKVIIQVLGHWIVKHKFN